MPRGTKRKIETPSVDEKAPKKMKLDLKYDSREENQLPDELVLQVLRQLERSDIVQCTMTCRQWYRVGQRDEFHWTFVTELTAVEFPAAYHFQRNKKLKDYAHLDLEEQIEELKLWQSDPIHSGTPVRIQSKKEGSLMAVSTHIQKYIWCYRIITSYDNRIWLLTPMRRKARGAKVKPVKRVDKVAGGRFSGVAKTCWISGKRVEVEADLGLADPTSTLTLAACNTMAFSAKGSPKTSSSLYWPLMNKWAVLSKFCYK